MSDRDTSRLFRSLDDPTTLRRFVEKIREGIYVTNVEGRILDANPAFVRMFGAASLAELRRHNVRDLLVDPTKRDHEIDLLERTEGLREFELEIRRLDGEIRTVLDSTLMVIHPEDGEILFHGVLVDITLRKELERRLHELSFRDPLTGCHNRRHLEAIAPELESRPEPFGVIALDVDRFKDYNDLHGHAEGDRVLRQLSRQLMRQVRVDDSVIRSGGDEFVILIVDQAELALEGVSRRVGALSGAITVPFSMGLALRRDAESLTSTVERADRTMFEVRAQERESTRTKG
jgi:diguanylate cyclase (GGDEF)-like protein/PAS domain S-box-containing protein